MNLRNASPLPGEDAAKIQELFDSLPLNFDDWQGVVQTIPEKQQRVAEAQAALSRFYVRKNHPAEAVQVMILYGAPGPLGAHTPEVCFEGAGMKQIGKPTKITLSEQQAEFWHGVFEPNESSPSLQHVIWGWSADHAWRASDEARFDFATHRSIFKLYLSWHAPRATSPATDPMLPFVRFMPKLLEEWKNRKMSSVGTSRSG